MRSRRALASVGTGAALVGLAVGGLVPEAGASDGADLLSETRAAVVEHDFSGVIEVEWTASDEPQEALVRVHCRDGSLSMGKADQAVAGEGTRRWRPGGDGLVLWSPVDPAALPSPDDKYDLTIEGGRTVAGRPATIVDARDPSDSVVERFSLDDATGVVLQRERLEDGRVTRRVSFVEFTDGDAGPARSAPAGAATQLETLETVESPPGAPRRAGDGFVLTAVAHRPDGAVHLFYSDGLYGVSVFEQRGQLDRDALGDLASAGGEWVRIAGRPGWAATAPSGEVVVWDDDGIVYTAVTDGPRGEVWALAEDLVDDRDASGWRRAIDFVLAPFSWG